MVYTFSAFSAREFISSVFTSRRVAIWSIKAPVPPAQVPFILASMELPRNIIFASSPPSSIITSEFGIFFSAATFSA